MAISFDEVVLAAEEIKQAGETPTIERIRLQLGSRGSHSTISKHLYTWRQSNAVLHVLDKKEAPNVVQAAVESAWHQLREKAGAEIEVVKTEAKAMIAQAEKQAQEAIHEQQMQNQQYRELQEAHNAVLAEKELLILDLRKLTEDYRQLEARHHGLNERYADTKAMNQQQLTLLHEVHQRELATVEKMLVELKHAHLKTIDEMKAQQEGERHQKMMVIDNLKTDHQKQEKRIAELGTILAENAGKIEKLTAELQASIKANDELKKTMMQQEAKWQAFNDKTLISTEVLAALTGLPAIEQFIRQWSQRFEVQFSAFCNEMKAQSPVAEVQDE
jgi:hypothetical protein